MEVFPLIEGIELLGTSEATRRLRVHEVTLRRWSESGKLPHLRDSSGKRLFFAEDIDKLARERAAKQKPRG